jgi:tRNA modification GTPase
MPGFKLKDYNTKDTIAAIATFPSRSALGVIKISGTKSLAIISRIFKPAQKKDIRRQKAFSLHYGWIVNKSPSHHVTKSPVVIDEVLVSIMRRPRSYTTEDVVEISSHGGPLILNTILDLVLKQGARLALPGEFTYRALIAGRIDLVQAESISGIVEAQTIDTALLAASQLKGRASRCFSRLKSNIKELFVDTESSINFCEEGIDISYSDIEKKVAKIAQDLDAFIEGSREARIIREGLKCVICGKTNAGKSTLFNRLLREERVIVSRIPGTTRDVIEETITIRGVPLKMYDTAGIFEPKDLVARKALEKTARIFDEADLVILILDGSRPLNNDDYFLLEKVKDKNIIIVINKTDLKFRLDAKKINGRKATIVRMSALKSRGLGNLEKAVYDKVYKVGADRENIVFLSQYQRQLLQQARASIGQIQGFLKEGRPVDFINLSLKECLDTMGRLTGEVFSEEILASIFSKFCIGK